MKVFFLCHAYINERFLLGVSKLGCVSWLILLPPGEEYLVDDEMGMHSSVWVFFEGSSGITCLFWC